jgi:hypothetical protein
MFPPFYIALKTKKLYIFSSLDSSEMRWIAVLVIVVLLAGAGFWYYARQHNIEVASEKCLESRSELQSFLLGVKNKDSSLCQSLDGGMRNRCLAYVAKDSSLCSSSDSECLAVASGNVSACFDPICKAWASGDVANCNELDVDSKEYCVNLVSLNAEYFAISEAQCLDYAKNV